MRSAPGALKFLQKTGISLQRRRGPRTAAHKAELERLHKQRIGRLERLKEARCL